MATFAERTSEVFRSSIATEVHQKACRLVGKRDLNGIVEKEVYRGLLSRAIEIEAILDWLVDTCVLKEENLFSGLVLDVGTGEGSGLFALRRLTMAPVFGIDFQPIPMCGQISSITCTTFYQREAVEFLSIHPRQIFSLITCFHLPRWGLHVDAYNYRAAFCPRDYYHIHQRFLQEVGRVLKPGSQLLITADLWQPWAARLDCDWGTRKIIKPVEGDDVLRLPTPKDLLKDVGPDSLSYYYSERDSTPETLFNFKDRFVYVFTKRN